MKERDGRSIPNLALEVLCERAVARAGARPGTRPRQVGEGPFVAAVDTAGPSAAQGTAYRALPGPQGRGDGGSGGLMRPGFERDQSRIRQQAGE